MLVWILLNKLLPQFSQRIGRLFLGYGRARDPVSWKTQFQRDWRTLETRTASEFDSFRYERYNPKPLLWVCSCPAFSQSRFLICKHLVQVHHPVLPRFFKQVSRNRSTPFWKPPGLRTLDQAAPDDGLDFTHPRIPLPEYEDRPDFASDDTSGSNAAVISTHDEGDDAVSAVGTVDSDSEDEAGFFNGEEEANQAYQRSMVNLVNLLRASADFIEHQVQFGDPRFLVQMNKEMARGKRFLENNLEHEKIVNSRRRKTSGPGHNFQERCSLIFGPREPFRYELFSI